MPTDLDPSGFRTFNLKTPAEDPAAGDEAVSPAGDDDSDRICRACRARAAAARSRSAPSSRPPSVPSVRPAAIRPSLRDPSPRAACPGYETSTTSARRPRWADWPLSARTSPSSSENVWSGCTARSYVPSLGCAYQFANQASAGHHERCHGRGTRPAHRLVNCRVLEMDRT
mgnify:CR=1 FL=1